MTVKKLVQGISNPVREDWVPKAAYLDPEFARLERERMWSRAWHVACREEELPKSGSFVTVDVATESFLVTRDNEGKLNAFHNVCKHRGRRLVTATAGRTHHLVCGFHAWRYNLDGTIRSIPDRDDWPNMQDCEVNLSRLKVDTWGGFVFVNMNLDAEPLLEFLGEAAQVLTPFEFENMRFRSIRIARLPVNWKIAVEAFTEGYHVQGTHPQALRIMEDMTTSFAHGPHSMFFQPVPGEGGIGRPSNKINEAPEGDPRPGLIRYVEEFEKDLGSIFADRHPTATRRLLTEAPATIEYYDALAMMIGFWRDAALECGAGWPENLTPEMAARAGTDWHIFPNLVTLMTPDAAVWYRVRPDGDNPESCFFDLWALQRYAPGTEPKVEQQYFDPWRDNKDWGMVYSQDFENAEQVQKGMKSSGFQASRTNPKQEVPISNFHRHIYKYLGLGD